MTDSAPCPRCCSLMFSSNSQLTCFSGSLFLTYVLRDIVSASLFETGQGLFIFVPKTCRVLLNKTSCHLLRICCVIIGYNCYFLLLGDDVTGFGESAYYCRTQTHTIWHDCCNQIHLNFLHSQVVGTLIHHSRTCSLPLVPKSHLVKLSQYLIWILVLTLDSSFLDQRLKL